MQKSKLFIAFVNLAKLLKITTSGLMNASEVLLLSKQKKQREGTKKLQGFKHSCLPTLCNGWEIASGGIASGAIAFGTMASLLLQTLQWKESFGKMLKFSSNNSGSVWPDLDIHSVKTWHLS